MKLIDRERVDGTQVTIGHRVYYQNGKQRVGRQFAAEYRNAEGQQVCETLRTSNKTQARRHALEIQQRVENGTDRQPESLIDIDSMAGRYFDSVKNKDVAPKTLVKYEEDLAKLKRYAKEKSITLARRFSADDLFAFRKWLIDQDYAPKTVDAILVLTKQAFKWAWRQNLTRDYRLAAASLPKAKASPQPCFTTEQVEALLKATNSEERLAFSMMAYAGLRIGEVEQLRWEDIRHRDGKPTMLHIRRGGSAGTTKDKDERFVPVHPRIADYLGVAKKSGTVFSTIRARDLLMRLKSLCKTCGFDKPDTFKLHSFRHHFASLCANHHVAYRKALAWLGHSSSEMLDLYYHLHDEDSQQAMLALAGVNAATQVAGTLVGTNGNKAAQSPAPENCFEGNLRAIEQSRIEKLLQVAELQELLNCLSSQSEREGFEPPGAFRRQRFSKPSPSAARPPLRGMGLARSDHHTSESRAMHPWSGRRTGRAARCRAHAVISVARREWPAPSPPRGLCPADGSTGRLA